MYSILHRIMDLTEKKEHLRLLVKNYLDIQMFKSYNNLIPSDMLDGIDISKLKKKFLFQ